MARYDGLHTQFGKNMGAAFLRAFRGATHQKGLEAGRHVPRQIGQIMGGAAQIEAVIDVEDTGHL